ncbi:MAG: formylglycine-generating enzyme family protein [Candidatus Poribacteria bacterium]|nr:formylglycine-generating enzyme family protein [Candidatus Poribacteria bacterium]
MNISCQNRRKENNRIKLKTGTDTLDIRLFFTTLLILLLSIAFTIAVSAEKKENPLILIPGGTFTMGNEKRAPDERPTHKVYLDAYYISKYEVTNAEYYEFWHSLQANNPQKTQESTQHTPENFTHLPHIGDWPERATEFPNHPIVGVSWHDAKAYAEWKGMRLPTEAEWEKAARGYSDRTWPWGNAIKPYANTSDKNDGYENRIAPVGSFPKGKSYFGVMDMAGNVWEWTADWYSDVYYFHSPKKNPTGPTVGSWRVIRGGSWIDTLPRCSTTFRYYFYPTLKTSSVGFRVAKTAEKPSK